MKSKKLFAGMLVCGLLAMQPPAMAARTFWDNGMEFNEIYCPTPNIHQPSPTMNEPPTIHIDGKYLVTDVDPTIVNGRTLMPFRAAGEALHATVNWDGATRTATAVKDGKTVKFTIDSKTFTINGRSHTTDVAPTIINNRTMLPLRAFAEAFDAKVDWSQYLYDVTIDTPVADAPKANLPSDVSLDAEKFIQKYYVAPDANDPYVGTWRTTNHNYSNSNIIKNDYYIFVTKVEDGYHCVEVSIEDWSNLNTNIITVMRDEAVSYYDATEDIDILMVDYNQDITYYRGPARGWTLSSVNTYTIFDDKLLFTGSYDPYGDRFNQPAEMILYDKL